MRSWLLPTFGVFVAWGLWSFIPKLTVRYIDPRSAVVYEVVGGALVAVTLLLIGLRPEFHPRGVALAMVTGVLGFLGALCFLYAVLRGPVSLITTVSALYPVVTISLAVLLLGESFTPKQGVGIAFALIAMVLIASG